MSSRPNTSCKACRSNNPQGPINQSICPITVQSTSQTATGEQSTNPTTSGWIDWLLSILLGTNDFGFAAYYNSTVFQARPLLNTTDYINALHGIQGKYADAELIITTSPLIGDYYTPEDPAQKINQLAAVKAAVARLGDKAHVVDFPSQNTNNNNIGFDYHPFRLMQGQDAVILTDVIKAVIG
jgi:hypothetical protein